MRVRTGYVSLLLILPFFLSGPAWADSGKDLFDRECAGCHTIGGGESGVPDLKCAGCHTIGGANVGGPDLKGVAEKRSAAWLERVIVEPDKLTADKDPTQLGLVKQYGGEMPNLGISRNDAKKIIAYHQNVSPATLSTGTAPSAEPAPNPVETIVTPELVAQGKALFTGGKSFVNGGAPCTACHGFGISGVTGGTLAVDLGDRVEGSGERGFRAMLTSLKFPIMREIYADRPLTEEETTALVVFAKDAVAHKASPSGGYFPVAGIGFFVCLIVGLTLYRRKVR